MGEKLTRSPFVGSFPSRTWRSVLLFCRRDIEIRAPGIHGKLNICRAGLQWFTDSGAERTRYPKTTIARQKNGLTIIAEPLSLDVSYVKTTIIPPRRIVSQFIFVNTIKGYLHVACSLAWSTQGLSAVCVAISWTQRKPRMQKL